MNIEFSNSLKKIKRGKKQEQKQNKNRNNFLDPNFPIDYKSTKNLTR